MSNSTSKAKRASHGVSRVQLFSDEDLGNFYHVEIDKKMTLVKKPLFILLLLNKWENLLSAISAQDMYRANPWKPSDFKVTAGRFIYRGEKKDYGSVSSGLYRFCAEKCTDWKQFSSEKKKIFLVLCQENMNAKRIGKDSNSFLLIVTSRKV